MSLYQYILSVSIPSYNRFTSLFKTVDNLVALNDKRIQIVICDNQSDNNHLIAERYSKYPFVKIVVNQEAIGGDTKY